MHRLLISFVLMAAICWPVAAQPYEPRSAKFREAVTLPIDSSVIKAMASAQDLVREKRWSQAIPLLQNIVETHSEALVPIEIGRYVNAADYCHLLLSRFPDEGLKLYRHRVNEQVRTEFEQAQQDLDEAALRRVLKIAFASSYGDDAALLLGELAYERGRFVAARSLWELLLPEFDGISDPNTAKSARESLQLTYPDPDVDLALIRAKCILCRLMSGDRARALQEWRAFQRLHPEAKGTLLGETGVLSQLLEKEFQAAVAWEFDQPSSGDVPTFGMSLTRQGICAEPVEPSTLSWRAPLPHNIYMGSRNQPALGQHALLSTFPIVLDGVAYVCGPNSVHAFDVVTGEPKWPAEGNTNTNGLIYQSKTVEVSEDDMLALQGVAHFSMTSDRGRVFARLGPPIVRRAKGQSNIYSEIVGLDVARREGDLVFHVTSDVLEETAIGPETTSWCFMGTPVVADDRVYVAAARSHPEDELVVVCFDGSTGQIVWRRRVAAMLHSIPEQFNLLGHRLLTLGDGRLFLETGSGAIASLDTETGRILWVTTYESQNQDETPFQFSDTLRHGLTPCVYSEGLVYVAPDDSDRVMALEAASGQIVWSRPLSDRILHVLGVQQGKLILSGRNLWALNASTGEFVWPERSLGFRDAYSRSIARGVLTEEHVYWPLPTEILQVDIKTGALRRRLEIKQSLGETTGHLLIANERLLMARTNDMLALGTAPAAPPRSSKTLARAVPHPVINHTGPLKLTLLASARSVPQPSKTEQKVETNTVPQSGSAATDVSLSNVAPMQWPGRQIWSRALPQAATVRLPESLGDHSRSSVVIVEAAHQRQVLRAIDGRDLWHSAALVPLRWSACFADQVLLGDSQRLECRAATSGQLRWSISSESIPPTGSIQRFQRSGPHSVAVSTEREVALIDLNASRIVDHFDPQLHHAHLRQQYQRASFARNAWQTKPAAIRALQPQRAPLDAPLVITNLDQACALLDSPLFQDPLMCDLRGTNLPVAWSQFRDCLQVVWIQPAAASSGTSPGLRVVTVTDGNRLNCFDEAGTKLWQSEHRLSVSFAQPRLLTADGKLYVLEDGLFLRRINLETGRAAWSLALGREPIRDLSKQVAQVGRWVLFAVDGHVECADLVQSQRLWKKYVGAGPCDLQATPTDTICFKHAAGDQPGTLCVFDTASGSPIQTWRWTEAALQLCSQASAPIALVASRDRVTAIGPR